MKYKFKMKQTYQTEINVVADSIDEAQNWVNENMSFIYQQEAQQSNIISEETWLLEDEPSTNEAGELYDLAMHISEQLDKYKHVSDYIPNEIHRVISKLTSHNDTRIL